MVLKIITVILLVVYFVIGIETIIRVKKSEGEMIDNVRKPLTIRINIIMVLTVLLAVLTLLNIFLK
ncbi:MAG: hypothetical protein IJT84_02645 [Clostridia bacterium]|nr:hypothetical protein [Clostridia bacterium]